MHATIVPRGAAGIACAAWRGLADDFECAALACPGAALACPGAALARPDAALAPWRTFSA